MTIEMIADYRIVQPLGGRGDNQFFLAQPPARLALDTDGVVVKVVNGVVGDEPFKRVVNELRIFAAVRSEHLVTLYDAGQEEGCIYYAMAYHPLGSLASPAQPLNPIQRMAAVADAARGAHDLHEAGVAHRNITPGNVLLVDGGATLSDLGLAKFLAAGMTVTRTGAVGAVEFLDPGIIRGDRASRASDIWSLGATLHRVLTGRPIYPDLNASDPFASMRRVLNERPTIDPLLPEAPARVIAACLARDPAERPPTALAVALALDAIGGAL